MKRKVYLPSFRAKGIVSAIRGGYFQLFLILCLGRVGHVKVTLNGFWYVTQNIHINIIKDSSVYDRKGAASDEENRLTCRQSF